MLRKWVSRVLAISIFTLFLSSITVSAHEATPFYLYPQMNTAWCWAATAQMLGTYAYPETNFTQSDAVNYYYGTDCDPYPSDAAGTIEDVQGATELIDCYTRNFNYEYSCLSASDIYDMIENRGQGIAAGLLGYPYDDSAVGHVVAIYGVYCQDGVDWVEIADPEQPGQIYNETYANFKNQTDPYHSYSGYKWVRSIYPS